MSPKFCVFVKKSEIDFVSSQKFELCGALSHVAHHPPFAEREREQQRSTERPKNLAEFHALVIGEGDTRLCNKVLIGCVNSVSLWPLA